MKTIHKERDCETIYYRDSYMHSGGWYSRERGLKCGDMREINGIISKVLFINNKGLLKKPQIHWSNCEPKSLRKVEINEKP